MASSRARADESAEPIISSALPEGFDPFGINPTDRTHKAPVVGQGGAHGGLGVTDLVGQGGCLEQGLPEAGVAGLTLGLTQSGQATNSLPWDCHSGRAGPALLRYQRSASAGASASSAFSPAIWA